MVKSLLEHLIAHQNTKDPWILVYDNIGSLPSEIGECINLNSVDSSYGLLFGFPVIREITSDNALSYNPVFSVRLSRQYLQPMIERLKRMVA